jgi:hypothetical protein
MQELALLVSQMMERQLRNLHPNFLAHARTLRQLEALKQLHPKLHGLEALVASAITLRGLGIRMWQSKIT